MKSTLNQPPPKEPRELWAHFSDTYFSLRLGLALLAFTLPFALYLYGKFRHGLDLQPSMSRYFWAATTEQCASFPMRTIFVGFLLAISVGLYLYKGLTDLENYLLNGASVCAALIAIYPERLSTDAQKVDTSVNQLFNFCPAIKTWAMQEQLPIHYSAAVTLFILLAIVAWACAYKSLEYVPSDKQRANYRRTYKIIAAGMILFPVPGVLAAYLLNLMTHWVFFVEAAGIITFGVYWLVKSRELALSRLEKDPEEAIQQRKKVEIRDAISER
jgi:hypothetical protein